MAFPGQPKAVIGVATTSGSTSRDTLGVLVSSVRPDSPAERAGINEGDRIASVNGVSLKLSPADVGDEGMAGAMARRLSRELEKLNPGDEVDLRVVSGGQTKTLKIKTVAPPESSDMRSFVSRAADRPTLGLTIALTGSNRDSLGVFVIAADDSGPAAKAGIVEGSRIASINGVDLRPSRSADENEPMVRVSNANRLERELSHTKPGDDVDLRVYSNGQYRDVKVKVARASDLPPRHRMMTFIGHDDMMVPSFRSPVVSFQMPPMSAEIRQTVESLRAGMGGFGRRVDW